ncbi:hypothetical protein LguiB_015604 [Lonicera macranthoides]
MAPVAQTNTISHFTHPGHRLSPVNIAEEYRCDGCKTNGTGARFRCGPCDFDLHEYCAACPSTLSSFMHPHPLNLVQRKPQSTRRIARVCDVCGDGVEGLFYRCKDCEFDVHPLCTQLPPSLRHPLHLPHPLIFRQWGSGWCAVCRGVCSSWRYRCEGCGFDIHLGCILVYCDLLNKRTTPSFNLPPQQLPQQVGGYGYAQLAQPPAAYAGGWGQSHVPPAYGGYGYGMPSGSHSNYQVNGSGEINAREGNNKTSMYSLVGKLALGVLSNVDLSSFI